MSDIERPSAEAVEARTLAAQGLLAERAAQGDRADRQRWRRGGMEIIAPLVFQRVTRPQERRRGHHRCASGIARLAPDCLDRYHDDLEAVLDDLFRKATLPIGNLEGWIVMRIPQAIVDGHRRRRGARGAAQRPRVPRWLGAELDEDPWLVELARLILDWVGIGATAGASLWPLTAWAERRAAVTGDLTAGELPLAAEIETVLTAMRRRSAWYESTVETPLGRKQSPVWSSGPGTADVPEPLVPVTPHEREDAQLGALAAHALTAITRRVQAGEDPRKVVTDVLHTVFGDLPEADGLDRTPGTGPSDREIATALINDPERLERIIEAILSDLG